MNFSMMLIFRLTFTFENIKIFNPYFNSCGQYLISGNHDGTITIWDTSKMPENQSTDREYNLLSHLTYSGHTDTVNGVRYAMF